jgi:putative oxidoreductase
MRNFFSSSPIGQTAGLTLIRLIVGSFMIYHGLEIFSEEKMNGYLQWNLFKDSPSARIMVYAGKAAELIGGILMFFGLFTRIASVILIVTMSYISFFVGHGKVWYEDQHPFLFVLLAFVFLFMGGGKISLDHALFKKRFNIRSSCISKHLFDTPFICVNYVCCFIIKLFAAKNLLQS